jgi:hypothetical protein
VTRSSKGGRGPLWSVDQVEGRRRLERLCLRVTRFRDRGCRRARPEGCQALTPSTDAASPTPKPRSTSRRALLIVGGTWRWLVDLDCKATAIRSGRPSRHLSVGTPIPFARLLPGLQDQEEATSRWGWSGGVDFDDLLAGPIVVETSWLRTCSCGRRRSQRRNRDRGERRPRR